MSIYEYKSGTDKLEIHASMARKNACFIGVNESGSVASIYIPNADVPTVAAELLKAAGQESVIVPKSDLATVTQRYEEDANSFRVGGESVVFTSAENAREWMLRDIAVWQHLVAREAAEKAEAEAAEKKLRERRDALAKEFTKGICYYESVVRDTKTAIDRIIELEDKLAGA